MTRDEKHRPKVNQAKKESASSNSIPDSLENYDSLKNHLKAYNPQLQRAHEEEVIKTGTYILENLNDSSKSIFNKDWWYGRIMEWSMKKESFKTQMFRFVDVLPSLNSNKEIMKHLKEYFTNPETSESELPPVFNLGVGVGSLAPGLMASAIKKNVQQMAKMFITGESPKDALPLLKKARKSNITFTADLLGEATLSEKEALDYTNRYTDLMEQLSADSKNWSTINLIDTDSLGKIPSVNISVKLSSLYSQINEKSWDSSVFILKEKLRPLFQKAIEEFCFINVDMESYHHKDLSLQVFKELVNEPEFREYRHFGIVIQAYLRDSISDLEELAVFAKERGTPFSIRLVKGAYWDYEVIHAKQNHWPIPVFTNKQESDANYEVCTEILLKNYPYILLAMGSHNVRSVAAGIGLAKKHNVPINGFEIQMLFGMADNIKQNLITQGFRLREYATVGELIPGMAYLVRRLLENTSNESFLKSKFADNIDTRVLLKDPKNNLEFSHCFEDNEPLPFENEALLDFTKKEPRKKMQSTLDSVRPNLGKEIPMVIQGKPVTSHKTFDRTNPSKPSELVGRIHLASAVEAELSIKAAKDSFLTWSNTPVEERSQVIDKLAQLILDNRYEIMAIEVFETGKPWGEADGDITEAVDFCRYYAQQMRELDQFKRTGSAPGEVTQYHFSPRGVTLVIAPWNFPLAILTGMVSAALVTGNTVIMKPAEQSSVVASKLMELALKAGVPAGALSFLPGLGEEVGEFLTDHKDIETIAFTGSKNVGLHIVNKAGLTHTGQKHVKRCIIEMGGKNAVIIDNDADLDEAVQGVIYSAFGFQGQKCSACSRVIVLSETYDLFLERLVEAAKSLEITNVENPKSYMGPLVDEEAYNKVQAFVNDAKKDHYLAFEGDVPKEGYYIPPTIFKDVDSKSKLAQEELFAPVLAVIKAETIEEAIEFANDTPYGLTGGLFSRSPGNIDKVKKDFQVGNLYINRGNTGAMVERHPFGGFKMSGLGSKTGCPDYLKQFMDPRCITENTLRRGFAPEFEG